MVDTVPAALITDALGDLGSILRRNQAGSLDQDSFYALVNSIRRKLKAARIACTADVQPEEMRRIGVELGRMLENGDLRPGTAVLPHGLTRARVHGTLVVIDGGRADTPANTLSDPSPKGAA